MAKSKKRYPKTFRPPLMLKLGALIPFLIASLFFISFLAVFFGGMLMGYNIPIGLAIFVGLFIYYFLFSVMWSCIEYIFHFAVVVTPKGIWFHGYGKRFYTWDSMIKLGKQKKWSSEGTNWGIITDKPKIVYRNRLVSWLITNWDYHNFIPLDNIVRVPRELLLFHDINKFKETEFGHELAYFAPHLFDTDKEKPKNRLRDAYHDNNYDIVETDRYQQEEQYK